MNRKVSIKTILIVLIILLLCLNIVLIAFNVNNNSNIEKRETSKEKLTSTSEYIDMATHLAAIKSSYEEGYKAGEATGSAEAFTYKFKVEIPCYFEFSIPENGWTKSSTVTYNIQYKGGTVTTSALNTATKATYSSDIYTTLELADANVSIIEKDKFTATFTIRQTLKASWSDSTTINATVKYDHGTTTYTFDTTNWSSGDFDMTMKKNGNATVTIL